MTPAVTVGLSDLAQQMILRSGGAAYLSVASAQELLSRKELHRVAGVPEITVPLYLMYPETHHDGAGLKMAIDGLLSIAD